MIRILFVPGLAIFIAACTANQEASEGDIAEPASSEISNSEGSTAPPPTESTDTAFAMSMPEAVRGMWREDDLGRAPTAEDCNQTSTSNRNFGKVLTVRADGYSLFETGGRIIEVHNRTDTMIDATFDTTYADTPTRARKDVALQPDGTLAVNDDDGDGIMSVTQYRRCPGQ